MRRSTRLSALVVALAAVLIMPVAAVAAPDLVPLCHRTSDNVQNGPQWVLIRVSERSVEKHLAHGDEEPLEPVPGSGGAQVFDAECNPEPSSTPLPEPPPAGELPSETDVVFALAYSDIDESGEYNEGDVMIAMLVDGPDGAADGIVGPGDRVITGAYPKDFTMSDFGTFQTTEHIVTEANVSTTYSCNVSSGDALFVFSSGQGDFDLYTEWSGADMTRIYDKRSSASIDNDEIRADTASPSQPMDAVASLIGSSDPVNHWFIEVHANCQA